METNKSLKPYFLKLFYVIYAKEDKINTYLNALCLLADPSLKNPAHLTVRGPYVSAAKKQRLKVWDEKIDSTPVFITGCGCFFNDRQNTIFLHCDSPEINNIWYKPDYKDGIPHITLYDGKSRLFAEKLKNVLMKYDLQFSFTATRLSLMKSKQGNLISGTLDNPDLIRQALNEEVDFQHIDELSEEKRLNLIDKLCFNLSSLSRRSDAHI